MVVVSIVVCILQPPLCSGEDGPLCRLALTALAPSRLPDRGGSVQVVALASKGLLRQQRGPVIG